MATVTAASERLWVRARAALASGVSSPVRAFGSVGGTPRFLRRGEGAYVWDADGNRLIDFVGAWGPLILGHVHPHVKRAIEEAARLSWSYGASTEAEVQLAEAVRTRMPALERLRFVTSGTEATMSALRVARAATGRDAFVKFEGAYHGHADSFLSKAGSGFATGGVPASAGVPASVAAHARTLTFNDAPAVEALLRRERPDIAAVLVEPVAGNMGVVPPDPSFLASLRESCDAAGALLIFDEVITGFRVGPGGAQERYGVRPDLTTLGKVLGGGLPLAAFGGRKDLMELLAPAGPVYQAGTMAANPLAVAAGLATLDRLPDEAYGELESRARILENGLRSCLGPSHAVQRVGSMLSVFLGVPDVRSWTDVRRTDAPAFARVFHRLLEQGILLPPSPYESYFVSLAHSSRDIETSIEAWRTAWEAIPSAVTPG